MLRQVHPVRAPQALIIVLAFTLLVSPFVAYARSYEVPQQPLSNGQFESTRLIGESTLLLDDFAPTAPTAFGAYRRFGFYVSPVQPLNAAVASIRVLYSSQIPELSAVLVDVRTSADAMHWTLWQTMEQSGDLLQLEQLARFAQYRVTLMANDLSPHVSSVQLLPQLSSAASNQLKAPGLALSVKVRATRQGMVGGRTANGHIITKRDRFVSLPCWCSLSTKGGNEYMVRLSYKGRSTVVPVYDVGPWNRRDNYWDPQPERYFSDLRQGWPQDHAAYYDGHNGGRSGLGWKVTFPTAVDVGDGAWWDDLRIVGDQAELEITFLWMGSDPAAAPPPSPTPLPPSPTSAPVSPTTAPEVAVPEATSEVPTTPDVPAVPATAAPEASTVPATAVPATTAPEASAVPATAVPATAMPAATTAPEASAVPATAVPATAMPATAVPATAVPTTAAPEASAVPATAMPATAMPATAVPATAVPATPLPATAIPPTELPTPTALPQKAANNVLAITIDDRDPGFEGKAKLKWYDSPKSCGWDEHALWTYSADLAANSENSARWQAKLPAAGRYDLQVYIPDCENTKPATQAASYRIMTADGPREITLSQARNAGKWVSLGLFSFSINAAVELTDVTGEDQRAVWFDAVRWIAEK